MSTQDPNLVPPSGRTSIVDSAVKSATPRRRLSVILIAGFLLLVVLSAGGFVVASTLEEQDSFCISCHTAPEVTYYNRAYIALDDPQHPITDLATQHYRLWQKANNPGTFGCIACHRGDSSLGHRLATLVLGGRDALIFVAGREDPKIEKETIHDGWLPNASCTACHAETLITLKSFDNHWHTHLPQAAVVAANGRKPFVPESSKSNEPELLKKGLETVNNSALTCTDCHQLHVTRPGGPAIHFKEPEQRAKACVSCHLAAKKGPNDPALLQ